VYIKSETNGKIGLRLQVCAANLMSNIKRRWRSHIHIKLNQYINAKFTRSVKTLHFNATIQILINNLKKHTTRMRQRGVLSAFYVRHQYKKLVTAIQKMQLESLPRHAGCIMGQLYGHARATKIVPPDAYILSHRV
jgi:hypothetical protein